VSDDNLGRTHEATTFETVFQSVIFNVIVKPLFHIMRSQCLSTIAVTVVIGAICFSLGEGLRLTPFSGLATSPSESILLQKQAGTASSTFRSGPLDVPVQNQRRNKPKSLDLACPTAHEENDPETNSFNLAVQESADLHFIPFVSRPAGRAPPFHS
jgi:hypothetical protein